jgi:hypothetical protein
MDWILRAKINRVLDCRSLDLVFDLGFSIKFRHDVFLNDYVVEDSLRAEAKNCLILLIGGHRVIVKSEKKDGIYIAKVYLYIPTKISGCNDDVGDKRLQCVNRVMSVLSSRGYDSEYLKSMLPDVRLFDKNEV